MKFDVAAKLFKLNILTLLLSEIYWVKRNNCCFIDWIKKKKRKKLNVDMHSDIFYLTDALETLYNIRYY